jgi:3-oxoacid CoA-transferase/3-oxoadipate CoA-transferase beta subunit
VNAAERESLARRVAADLRDGDYVNLGIGLPGLVANHVAGDIDVIYESENGLLGVGPAPAADDVDPELINASKQPVTLLPGASIFDTTTSFMMIRGGHIDIALLGAYEVAENGDLANWTTNDIGRPPAVGGAMDLAAGAKHVWVMMEHCTSDGQPRLLSRCTYPLTAAGVVSRVYTDLAVIDVDQGFVVRELRGGVTFGELQARSGAPLRLSIA